MKKIKTFFAIFGGYTPLVRIHIFYKLYFGGIYMANSTSEYAMIKISVTTANGIVPIEGARVSVFYEKVPRSKAPECQTNKTDASGRTSIFRMPVKRAVIGGKVVDFPRRAECDVEISAEGYITRKVRSVHLFPGITVCGCFDLVPVGNHC